MASTIQSTGIGSGLDIASIVAKLTEAQGDAPTKQLKARETELKAQVSAYGTFRSALEALQATLPALQDAGKFQGRTASIADESIADANAQASAIPATYSLEVTALAKSANLVSGPIASADSTIGTGTLSIAVGGVSVQINIDASNNTLAGIAASINSAVGNPGVNASIINTAGGARLVLNGTKTGVLNVITVTQSGGDGGLSQLVYDPANNNTQLTQAQAAQDAQFTLNGFAATSASNEVTGVISGVNFTLRKVTAANTPTTLTIGFDKDAGSSAITTFVKAYNAFVDSIKVLTSYDPDTKVAGTLLGNTAVNGLVAKVRQILTQSVPGSTGGVQTLTDLGITASLQGTLTQSESKLSAALSSNLKSITDLLSGKTGLATRLDDALKQFTQPGGYLDTVNQGLSKGLRDVNSKKAALQLRLDEYTARLSKQFNATDAAVAALRQTQSFITQAFDTFTTAQKASAS